MRRKIGRIGWIGIAVTALLAGASPAAAAVAPPAGARSVQTGDSRVLEITSTDQGLFAPATATPGPTTFHTTTTTESSGWIGLARPHDGVSWEEFRATLRKVISTSGPDIVSGSEELKTTADLLGGTVIYPHLPASFSQTLRTGRYWLFDYQHIHDAQPRYRTLTVSGTRSGQEPSSSVTVTAKLVGGAPRFVLSGTVRAGQPIRFVNAMPVGQPAEAIFFPMPDGVTEEDLQEWIDKFGDNGQWPDDPGPLHPGYGTGGLPMSSGVSSVLQLPLEPGRYVIWDWMRDARDGVMLVKKGHYEIIEVR